MDSQQNKVTMPKWPAWIMGLLMVVSAYPALTASAPAREQSGAAGNGGGVNETYDARGAEPGWMVSIGGGRLHYAGDYSDQRIDIARPEPLITATGRRYASAEMSIDLDYQRCNDALSGQGFEHRVTVTVGQQVMHGCGGARRADWDQ